MRNRSEYMKGFMQDFQYPAEAIDFLLLSYDKIWANESAKILFEQCIDIDLFPNLPDSIEHSAEELSSWLAF